MWIYKPVVAEAKVLAAKACIICVGQNSDIIMRPVYYTEMKINTRSKWFQHAEALLFKKTGNYWEEMYGTLNFHVTVPQALKIQLEITNDVPSADW